MCVCMCICVCVRQCVCVCMPLCYTYVNLSWCVRVRRCVCFGRTMSLFVLGFFWRGCILVFVCVCMYVRKCGSACV